MASKVVKVTISRNPAEYFFKTGHYVTDYDFYYDIDEMAWHGTRKHEKGPRYRGKVSLRLAKFVKSNEHCISLSDMADRAEKIGANLGRRYAVALFKNQHLIPKEWRKFRLFFPGTFWVNNGHHSTTYLYLFWSRKHRYWYHEFLSTPFGSAIPTDRLLRAHPSK